MYMFELPRIYPFLTNYTPLFSKFICATLPESTPPSQNIPPFLTNLYNDPPCVPEATPPSQNIFQFWERVVDSLTYSSR